MVIFTGSSAVVPISIPVNEAHTSAVRRWIERNLPHYYPAYYKATAYLENQVVVDVKAVITIKDH